MGQFSKAKWYCLNDYYEEKILYKGWCEEFETELNIIIALVQKV